jgi:transcription elongation factor GreA
VISNAPVRIPFTAQAYAKNQAEFTRLTELRKVVVERLQTAREMGDLSENGAYHAAKFELGSIGRQLRELRHMLFNGYVPTIVANDGVADFGRTITLKNDEKEFSFILVSEYESDPKLGKLSLKSPIGAAVKGKKIGDTVEVETPKGMMKYIIQHIS